MTKNKDVTIVPGAGELRKIPALSGTLSAWLREGLAGLSSAGSLQDIDLTTENIPEIGAAFLRAAEFETAGRVAQGYYLARMVAISETSTRAFLAEHGISWGTGHRLITDFGLFNASLTLDQIRRLSEIDFTKRAFVAEIAGEDGLPQLLDGRSVNGLTFEQAKVRGLRELDQMRKQQRENDIRIKKYKERAVLAEEQRDALRAELERALTGAELPRWCVTMRSESVLQGEVLTQIVDQLRETFFEEVVGAHEPKSGESRVRLQQMAGGTLYRTVRAAAARLSAFSTEIKEHFGDEIELGDRPDEILTPAEIEALEERRRDVVDRSRAEFEQRQLERLNQAKTGRGRKLTKLPKKPASIGRPRKAR